MNKDGEDLDVLLDRLDSMSDEELIRACRDSGKAPEEFAIYVMGLVERSIRDWEKTDANWDTLIRAESLENDSEDEDPYWHPEIG